MKTLLLSLVLAVCLFSFFPQALRAQYGLPDSLIFRGIQCDVGQTFRTGLATTFGHLTVNGYFKDAGGIEHIAYIDNYKLYYFKSTDNGVSWSKQHVITGHEGALYLCALTVDTLGKVFIGFTAHDLFNYANPSGITDGSMYFFYDAYCVTNKTGSWVTEPVFSHGSDNAGARVAGLFVDAQNNVHLIANRYGWYSYGGIAWEWVRNSTTDNWGATQKIVEFTDAGVDRVIYDTYTIVPDPAGNVTLLACRYFPPTPTRLFYVRYNGSVWSAPVNITDTVTVAWNRFDAVVDPAGHTYIAYFHPNAQGLAELLMMKDFQPAQTVSLNLSPNDTLNYFRLHCNAAGLFTMYLTMVNQNVHVTFSSDAFHWSDPIEAPNDLKTYVGGVIVKTDTRRGYFSDYCEQLQLATGPRSGLPYGPDTLLYGSMRILGSASAPALLLPVDAATIDSQTVFFNWAASTPEITRYWMEVDTTSSFLTPFIDSTITDTNYQFNLAAPNKVNYWRVKAGNQRGWSEYSGSRSFTPVVVAVHDRHGLPAEYSLDQNFPNPFNPATMFKYSLPVESHVRLIVYNMLGQPVTTLMNGIEPAGYKSIGWNAGRLASGIYYFRLDATSTSRPVRSFGKVGKMLLVK